MYGPEYALLVGDRLSVPNRGPSQVKNREVPWRREKALGTRHAPNSIDCLTRLPVVSLRGTRKDNDWIVLDEKHFFNADAVCEGQPLAPVDPVLSGNLVRLFYGIQQRALSETEVGIGSVEQFTSRVHTASIAESQRNVTTERV